MCRKDATWSIYNLSNLSQKKKKSYCYNNTVKSECSYAGMDFIDTFCYFKMINAIF